jgi:phage terminase large subunit-like protein
MNMEDSVVVAGSSYENKSNLDPGWFTTEIGRYEGTRLGRQEIHAELLDDLPGALWTRDMLEQCTIDPKDLENWKKNGFYFKRIVVAVDPSGTAGSDTNRTAAKKSARTLADKADDIGIIAAGLGSDDKAYVLADRTCNKPPAQWGKDVVSLYKFLKADKIVAERNFGGAMVEHVIASVDRRAPVKLVSASRGKVARAEPVASLYEQGLVKHVGSFPQLEDQFTGFAPNGYIGARSPDRADAAIWAITELLIDTTIGSFGVIKIKAGHY